MLKCVKNVASDKPGDNDDAKEKEKAEIQRLIAEKEAREAEREKAEEEAIQSQKKRLSSVKKKQATERS